MSIDKQKIFFAYKRADFPLGENIVFLKDIDSLGLQYFMQPCRIWQYCIV